MFLCANSIFSFLDVSFHWLFFFFHWLFFLFIFIGHIFLPFGRILSGSLHYWLYIICSMVCVCSLCVLSKIYILLSGSSAWFGTFHSCPLFLSSIEQPLPFQNEYWLPFKDFYTCGLCYYPNVVLFSFALGQPVQTISH